MHAVQEAPGGVSRNTPHVVPVSLPGVPGLVSSKQAIGMPLTAVSFRNSQARQFFLPPQAAQHSAGDGRWSVCSVEPEPPHDVFACRSKDAAHVWLSSVLTPTAATGSSGGGGG